MAKVFLSYRHENDANYPNHQARVRELGEKLRAAKLDVILDQFYQDTHPGGPDEQWPKWCENQVPAADKVVMIASVGYFRCYDQRELPGTGLGAACETTVIRNTLYDCGYVTDKFRFVYFDKAHLADIPAAVKGIHRFDASDPADVTKLIAWLGTSPLSVPRPTMPLLIWPSVLTSYEPDLANRGDEFAFFTAMLAGTTAERALLVEAPSNYGKTTLIAECMKYARAALSDEACVTVDFKGNPSKEFALDTLRLELASLLPNFRNPGSAPIELRADLRALAKPTVLLFDTYEKASIEARELVEGLLLVDLDKLPALRIVVAGQTVPNPTKTLWAKSVRAVSLGPIRDAAHWVRFAKRHHPHLQPEQIQTLTDATGGQPGFINTLITGLAQKRPR